MMSNLSESKGTLNKKEKKEDSLLQRVGTLGKKNKKPTQEELDEEEARRLEIEGVQTIEIPCSKPPPEVFPEDYVLEEGEERSLVTADSREDPKVKEVIALLINWINDELVHERIVVKDIVEDIYDGHVIQKLLEKLSGLRVELPEVTQSVEGQLQKLYVILTKADQILARANYQRAQWNAESIHTKNLVAILHLLIAFALHFRAPIRFPEHVSINVIVVQKRGGQLVTRQVTEELTSTQDELGLRGDRDAFDTLFDHAPDKLNVVKKSLVTFVNRHLNKINFEVDNLDTQFHDGVFLVLLMGSLEGYFVPFYSFHLTPKTFEQKVHNVGFAFELMQDAGLPKPKSRPEDIVNMDVKCTLRVLYGLFTKYKHVTP